MQMTTMDKIRLMKAAFAANTVENIVVEETPVEVVTPGEKTLTSKEKNVKGNATAGNITINLPTTGMADYDAISITKMDNTTNTITVSGFVGDDVVLTYQYQTIIAVYDGTNWVLTNQQLPPTSTTPQIHVGITAPDDTKMLWCDINE